MNTVDSEKDVEMAASTKANHLPHGQFSKLGILFQNPFFLKGAALEWGPKKGPQFGELPTSHIGGLVCLLHLDVVLSSQSPCECSCCHCCSYSYPKPETLSPEL